MCSFNDHNRDFCRDLMWPILSLGFLQYRLIWELKTDRANPISVFRAYSENYNYPLLKMLAFMAEPPKYLPLLHSLCYLLEVQTIIDQINHTTQINLMSTVVVQFITGGWRLRLHHGMQPNLWHKRLLPTTFRFSL